MLQLPLCQEAVLLLLVQPHDRYAIHRDNEAVTIDVQELVVVRNDRCSSPVDHGDDGLPLSIGRKRLHVATLVYEIHAADVVVDGFHTQVQASTDILQDVDVAVCEGGVALEFHFCIHYMICKNS